MRTLVATAVTVVVVVLVGGCSGAGESAGSDDRPDAGTSEEDVAVVDSEACEEVRTGIAAFNDGDYGGTVEHFEAALPLAEARDDGSEMAGDLVEAVRYYAELDAEEYPEAARSSPEFARYKAITSASACLWARSHPSRPGRTSEASGAGSA